MRTKKTFVLLEILIGFALVSISILPFLRYPYRHMQKELDMLFQMQLTRYAQERLCAIEREMCANEIDPEYLFNTEKKIHELKPALKVISLPNGWDRRYEEHLKFEWTAQRKDEKFLYSLVHVHLSYHKGEEEITSFHSELVAQKKL